MVKRVITIQEIQEVAMKKGKRLTMKQAEFTKRILEGKSGTQAVKDVYELGRVHKGGKVTEKERENTAKAMASENMAKPYIRETVEAIASRVGLTREFVLDALQEDIEAKPRRRIQELALASKILRLEEPPKVNVLSLNVSEDQANRILGLE